MKGHAGQEHNERADRLAALGRHEFMTGRIPAVEISAPAVALPAEQRRLHLV